MYARTILLLLATAGLAQAQYPGSSIPRVDPYTGGIGGINQNPYPPVSPYLNLLRGNSPVVNYLFDVQPRLDAEQQMQSFAAQPFRIGALSPLRSGFLNVGPATGATSATPFAFEGNAKVDALLSTGRPATYNGSSQPGLSAPPATYTPFGQSLPSYQSTPKSKK